MAKAVEELQSKRHYFGIISGKPGTKKTSLAMTAGKTLMIDTENGLPRVSPQYRHGFFASVDSWEDMMKEFNPANPDCVMGVIDTVVIDTLGSLFDLAKKHVIAMDSKAVQGDGSLTWKGYGKIGTMLIGFFISTLKLKNLIIVAHTTEGKDGDALRFKIYCEGATKDQIWKFADFGCFADTRGKDVYFCFASSPRYDSKRIGNLKDEYKYGDDDCNVGKWFATLDNITAQNSEITQKYDNVITQARAIIDAVKTADDANKAIELLGTLEQIGESKSVTWLMLKRQCSSVGLVFENKAFVVKGCSDTETKINETFEKVKNEHINALKKETY